MIVPKTSRNVIGLFVVKSIGERAVSADAKYAYKNNIHSESKCMAHGSPILKSRFQIFHWNLLDVVANYFSTGGFAVVSFLASFFAAWLHLQLSQPQIQPG